MTIRAWKFPHQIVFLAACVSAASTGPHPGSETEPPRESKPPPAVLTVKPDAHLPETVSVAGSGSQKTMTGMPAKTRGRYQPAAATDTCWSWSGPSGRSEVPPGSIVSPDATDGAPSER